MSVSCLTFHGAQRQPYPSRDFWLCSAMRLDQFSAALCLRRPQALLCFGAESVWLNIKTNIFVAG